MPFSPDDLELLANEEEVRIETRAADGTAHRTIIWVVVDEGDVFVRSVRGTRGRWYREALADPDVAIQADHRRLPARAIHAPDPDSVARTSAALVRKYAGIPGLEPMMQPNVLQTTMCLEPA
jgi:hypothetical protein